MFFDVKSVETSNSKILGKKPGRAMKHLLESELNRRNGSLIRANVHYYTDHDDCIQAEVEYMFLITGECFFKREFLDVDLKIIY